MIAARDRMFRFEDAPPVAVLIAPDRLGGWTEQTLYRYLACLAAGYAGHLGRLPKDKLHG